MNPFRSLGFLFVFLVGLACPSVAQESLRVVLIPADGGTEEGTREDFQPVFDAVARQTGLSFKLIVGSSYAAVVQALHNNQADVAFLGPVAFVQAHRQGDAELLAVAVENGRSAYYAGIFVRRESPVKKIADLRGHGVAFGDINSASSFIVPAALIMAENIQLEKDLGRIVLAGSHAAALQALAAGKIDAACASFEAFEKAVGQGVLLAKDFRVLARSAAIPYPPLAMNPRLPGEIKTRLVAAFADVHRHVPAGSLRGYGGRRVERYATTVTAGDYTGVAELMERVGDDVRAAVLRKAADGR